MNQKIAVIGSLNMDLVVKAERSPESGETLFGQSFQTTPGGKGANQAVAIAKLGHSVAMIGKVGRDMYGSSLIESAKESGVDVSMVGQDPVAPTGIALIIVEESGDNRILIVSGANSEVSNTYVEKYIRIIKDAGFLVLQAELPWDTVKYSLRLANEYQVPSVLNLAPPRLISGETLKSIQHLVVNESEATYLSGITVKDHSTALEACANLIQRGAQTIIVTLGDKGCVLANRDGSKFFPAHNVEVVDTTAAGDAFIGGFVSAMSTSNDLSKSVHYATAVAALTVTRFGAQSSLPNKDEVDTFLKSLSNSG